MYLVEIEHKIQFTDIMKIFVEDFNKIVYRLQVAQIIVIYVYAYAEIEPCVPSVDYFEVSKL